MGQDPARARWRDALVVTVLGIVLLAGLIHYGLRLSDGRTTGPTTDPERTVPAATTAAPQAEATASLESAPPTDPAQPAEPPPSTCWDEREVASLRMCGLPEGARGLAWVFPSFSRDECHRARRAPAYEVVVSFECFERARGRPVTITYDHVTDVAAVERWLERTTGPDRRIHVPGAHGGRSVYLNRGTKPVRITGTYAKFPYVVSVFAPTHKVAERAWRTLIERRPPQAVLGTKAG